MNDNSLTTSQWLNQAITLLESHNVPTARLDALVLLEDATSKDRAWLLAHSENVLPASRLKKLDAQVERRSKHEPLAYIREQSEFYGRIFRVNAHTLEPRPETETMIDLLKQIMEAGRWKVEDDTIVDVGTGSGCIAVTAKLEFPNLNVFATDIDPECIAVGKHNAKNLGANITFLEGNLLQPLLNPKSQIPNPDIILVNLPYVPESYTINKAAEFEPRHAIFGGPDGLDLYRTLFAQLETLSTKPSYILTESLPFQHHGLATIARKHGYILEKTDDFIQIFRI